MSSAGRRFIQGAVALVLGSVLVLVTQWAFPAGHLAIHLGRPQYSRFVGETSAQYVSIELRVQNVGVDPVRVDREHFLLVDNAGRIYQTDPSTMFEAFHAAATVIWPLHDLRGTVVFRLPPDRTAVRLLYVTTTGEIVRIKLS
ncbi:MAG TPA: DUF4352 domain-containing protein [bacterium]|nr:DUF4352 domain-containing protein [bacterium]